MLKSATIETGNKALHSCVYKAIEAIHTASYCILLTIILTAKLVDHTSNANYYLSFS